MAARGNPVQYPRLSLNRLPATGGVGTVVVPLLAAAKAWVVATATSADADILRGLGAEEIIGYAHVEYSRASTSSGYPPPARSSSRVKRAAIDMAARLAAEK
jgi:hypothetical protein